MAHARARRHFVDLRKLKMVVVAGDQFQLAWLKGTLQGVDAAREAVTLEACREIGEALERAEHETTDVCFFDAGLGEARVLTFLRKVRALGNPFPVILIARPEEEDLLVRAMQAGASDYLIKGETDSRLLVRSIRYSVEIHRAHRKLRLLRRRFRTLFDRSLSGSFRLSEDGVILDCNLALAHLLGYESRQDLVGRSVDELVVSRPGSPRGGAEFTRRSFGREFCLRRRDGSHVWVRISQGHVEEEGEESFLEGSLVDVTEAKRLAGSVKEVSAQYMALFDVMSEGMIAIDREGLVTTCNARAETILGKSLHELRGEKITACFPALVSEDRELQPYESLPPVRSLRSRKPAEAAVFGFQREDGSETWVSMRATPVTPPGQPESFAVIASLTDLSELKLLRAELVHAQKMEVVGRMASGVSHDLRNLLTAVSGYADLLLRDPELCEDTRASAEEIRRAAKRAIALANEMLDFSRRDTSRLQSLDIDDLLLSLDGILERLTGGVELGFELDSSGCMVLGDGGQLEQVILNLIINARDATPNYGSITVRTRPMDLGDEAAQALSLEPGPYVALTVEDTGCGMDEQVKERVFEPFFTTKEEGKGTGLGLSTVREIVRRSRGEVTIDSEPDQGTRVVVYLPRVAEAIPAR